MFQSSLDDHGSSPRLQVSPELQQSSLSNEPPTPPSSPESRLRVDCSQSIFLSIRVRSEGLGRETRRDYAQLCVRFALAIKHACRTVKEKTDY